MNKFFKKKSVRFSAVLSFSSWQSVLLRWEKAGLIVPLPERVNLKRQIQAFLSKGSGEMPAGYTGGIYKPAGVPVYGNWKNFTMAEPITFRQGICCPY